MCVIMNNAHDLSSMNSIDLFRISRSKKVADISPNTVRKLHRERGLRIYYSGGASWVSKSELEALIKTSSTKTPHSRRGGRTKKCPVVIRGENLDSDRNINQGL